MYRDIRFEFLKDNPFANDSNRDKCKKLITYMDNNLKEFTEKTDHDISFMYINPSITHLFGMKIEKNDKYSTPLINTIKDFIMNSQSLPNSLKDQWKTVKSCDILIDIDDTDDIQEDDEILPDNRPALMDSNDNDDDDNNEFGPITPIIPEKFTYSRTAGLTNYDISTNKPLSYDDVRRLTTNIARSELVPVVNEEGYKMKLEEQKRLELQDTINQYRKIRDIGALTQDDLSTMSITQLTELARIYKKAYDEKKLYTVFKKSGNIVGTITSTVFPNGIRIGKDEKTGNERYIQMKGAIKEITNQIFDSSSVQGYAFSNLLKKSNINVSDSVLAVISIAETMISNIQVVEVPSVQQQSDIPEITNNTMDNMNNYNHIERIDEEEAETTEEYEYSEVIES